MITEV